MKKKVWFIASFILAALLIGLWAVSANLSLPQAHEKYDVIVIGGEPEGVAAAVSAARNGAKTLLLEHRKELGGLFTYGMLNFLDIPQGEDGNSISKGIFKEWHALVGNGNAFGIEEAKSAFKKLVDEEENLTLLTETSVDDVIVDNKHIQAIKVSNRKGTFEVEGGAFIDATQDADFAVMSGAPYFIGGEDIGLKDKKMSVTLMIHLKNLDWEGIKRTAKSEKFGDAVVTDKVAWGFSGLHYDYKPVETNTRLRGLNLARAGDEYYINALQIFGVDGLDPESKAAAIEKGKREIQNILAFLQKEFPGFENAEIASIPSELYVRETRHILAEYQLPMSDVWTNRDHWDNIGYGAYPVDIQAQTPQDYGNIASNPKQYAIPFRSLVPKEIDGLLVVGRSAGFSSIAAGSARVVPTGMTTGEAAGAAAELAVREGVTFREMSKRKELIESLRHTLANQGAFVERLASSYPYEGEWYDESIQTLINYGLIYGRYDNDLRVDEPASKHAFVNIVKEIFARMDLPPSEKFIQQYHAIKEGVNGPILRDEAAEILVTSLFEDKGKPYWVKLISEGIISEETAKRIGENKDLTNKEMYAILTSLFVYLKDS